MDELWNNIRAYVSEHWIEVLVAACTTIGAWFLGKYRARSKWLQKSFLDRLNVSLNSVVDGKLLIRTILEKSCKDVFLNDVAVERVTQMSRSTTEKDPLLPLGEDDYWYYLNSILNEIAERFADGPLRQDAGQSVTKATYLICLTCECAGELRTRKVRAMLVQKQLLTNLPEEVPQFESPHHTTRWDTLRIMAEQYKSKPYRFIEMEICL